MKYSKIFNSISSDLKERIIQDETKQMNLREEDNSSTKNEIDSNKFVTFQNSIEDRNDQNKNQSSSENLSKSVENSVSVESEPSTSNYKESEFSIQKSQESIESESCQIKHPSLNESSRIDTKKSITISSMENEESSFKEEIDKKYTTEIISKIQSFNKDTNNLDFKKFYKGIISILNIHIDHYFDNNSNTLLKEFIYILNKLEKKYLREANEKMNVVANLTQENKKIKEDIIELTKKYKKNKLKRVHDEEMFSIQDELIAKLKLKNEKLLKETTLIKNNIQLNDKDYTDNLKHHRSRTRQANKFESSFSNSLYDYNEEENKAISSKIRLKKDKSFNQSLVQNNDIDNIKVKEYAKLKQSKQIINSPGRTRKCNIKLIPKSSSKIDICSKKRRKNQVNIDCLNR